jgi:hypothetical protein
VEAVRVRCLRLSLLSGTGMLLRPMTFGPLERVSLGSEVSCSRFSLSGTKCPIYKNKTKFLMKWNGMV